ncbi:hypothetical protein KSB_66460 [Ktedonobacter robiniae]|uniref:Uncharacterized protein n=1 Tax=Ktedonobacter robiniae TaxID=2778365 RepID=A0ABQ3UZM5_9CHLR|nr:hypothetical protein KSB_66460 [Ktedonobacter robiniae]
MGDQVTPLLIEKGEYTSRTCFQDPPGDPPFPLELETREVRWSSPSRPATALFLRLARCAAEEFNHLANVALQINLATNTDQ